MKLMRPGPRFGRGLCCWFGHDLGVESRSDGGALALAKTVLGIEVSWILRKRSSRPGP